MKQNGCKRKKERKKGDIDRKKKTNKQRKRQKNELKITKLKLNNVYS